VLPGIILFNSNNFATSAALAEVCAVLSVIPVVTYLFIYNKIVHVVQNKKV